MHVGCMLPGHIPGTAQPGPICLEAQRTGAGNFLANLALFPGKYSLTHCHLLIIIY